MPTCMLVRQSLLPLPASHSQCPTQAEFLPARVVSANYHLVGAIFTRPSVMALLSAELDLVTLTSEAELFAPLEAALTKGARQ